MQSKIPVHSIGANAFETTPLLMDSWAIPSMDVRSRNQHHADQGNHKALPMASHVQRLRLKPGLSSHTWPLTDRMPS
jgi:hypothetical protein